MDSNTRAKEIVDISVGSTQKRSVNSHKSKGGVARAASLSPEDRSAIARKAAKARWSK